jgi:hypothetical protein
VGGVEGLSPECMLKLWLRALAPFMPRAGLRCGLLEERDLFTGLFSTPSRPSAPGMLLSNDLGIALSRGSPSSASSDAWTPNTVVFLSPPELSRFTGVLQSLSLDLLVATELFEASFKLSFSCFPGTVELFLSNWGDFMRTLSPTGRRVFSPFSRGF